MDIALATCDRLPDLSPLDAGVLVALRELGLDAQPVVWSEPSFDWSRPRAVIVQSTWDCHLRPAQFLAWADAVERLTPLFNPARVLRWNMHKHYLRALAAHGVDVTPTVWLARGERIGLATLMGERGWRRAVVKPAISAGANETHVIAQSDAAAWQERIDRLARDHDLMIQPYLRAFETEGERSYVFFDGVFSHAIQRPPTLKSAARGFDDALPCNADRPGELPLAQSTLHAVQALTGSERPPLYARVDLASNEDGVARLQEVELIEPSLFTALVPGSADRLATAIAARLATRP